MAKTYNVLFLCTGNSARSIIAEVVLNGLAKKMGKQIQAFSAGSRPGGQVNPFAIELLRINGYATESLRSKSWDEFAAPTAPTMDIVITVCNNAAGEACPTWPGQPVTAHWGFEDPAAYSGSEEEKRARFVSVYRLVEDRLRLFLSLPIDRLDRASLQEQIRKIGEEKGTRSLEKLAPRTV